MDTLLLSLFITFILLVIIDAFLTYVGVRRGHQERMCGTKKLIEKYGLQKGLKVKSLILAGLGILFWILFFAIELIIPEFHLAAISIYVIIVILFSCVAIQNIVQLLKYRHKQVFPKPKT